MAGRIGRRGFLAGAAAVAGLTVPASCTAEESTKAASTNAVSQGKNAARENFFGVHQMGILLGPAAYGVAVAFDCIAADKGELAECLRTISNLIHTLTTKPLPEPSELGAPAEDNGLLIGAPDRLLSGTVSVGATLFDGRYGLGPLKPEFVITQGGGYFFALPGPKEAEYVGQRLIEAKQASRALGQTPGSALRTSRPWPYLITPLPVPDTVTFR